MARTGSKPRFHTSKPPQGGVVRAAKPSPAATGVDSIARPLSLEALPSAPPGRSRSIVNVFIALFLLWQTAVPLSYYLGEDRSDERFAWRMFSAVNRLHKTCIVSLGEWRPDGSLRALRPDEFVGSVPAGWMKFLHRDRVRVIERFLSWHCRANPSLQAVEMLRKCDASDGTGETLDSFKTTCLTGSFRRTREIP